MRFTYVGESCNGFSVRMPVAAGGLVDPEMICDTVGEWGEGF